jgi:hypothetical protein
MIPTKLKKDWSANRRRGEAIILSVVVNVVAYPRRKRVRYVVFIND